MRTRSCFRAASAAVALLGAPLAVSAQTSELPPRKAGLWEISTTGIMPNKTQVCVDAASDRELMEYSLSVLGRCKSVTTKRAADHYVVAAECTEGAQTVKSTAEITGDFNSAYTMRTESFGVVTTQTANWQSGDCGGLSPGDINSAGIKINIKQAAGLLGAAGRIVDKLPPRRAGQWEVSYEQELPGLPDGSPSPPPPIRPPPSRMCINAASDSLLMEIGLGLFDLCMGGDLTRQGSEWVVEDRCDAGGFKLTKRTTISGDFQTTITVRSTKKMDGPITKTLTTFVETLTARWVGEACTGGLVPGDIELHGTTKMNVLSSDVGKAMDALDKAMDALEKLLPPSDKGPPPPTSK
jgi:hypothetical protein